MHGGHVHRTAGMRRSSEDEVQRQRGNQRREGTVARGGRQGREKHKDGKDVDLGDAQELGGVYVVPVSEFVG